LTLAAPAAAQAPAATYVVLGAQGPVARAVIPAGTTGLAPACPAIMVDGNSQTMSLRAEPDANFPILVCEFALGSAKSASIGGQPLPLPPAKKLKSVAVFGDTGCRLKADKNAALAARDTDEADEVDENGKFQDCNNTDDWPFAPMSETIAEAKPDLVLLDVMMPQVDGWEMLRRMQELYGASAIPVVMFSGKVDEHSESQAATRGAQGFVGKPFDLQQLIDRTKQLAPV
ncbi:MAG: response regulator, partial [Actinobacteria bacterium]|nr:response regulator [Actinomycetota bacterium]